VPLLPDRLRYRRRPQRRAAPEPITTRAV
jgi:hypothetical protein